MIHTQRRPELFIKSVKNPFKSVKFLPWCLSHPVQMGQLEPPQIQYWDGVNHQTFEKPAYINIINQKWIKLSIKYLD